MTCGNCGMYYPDDEGRCPYCSWVYEPKNRREAKRLERMRKHREAAAERTVKESYARMKELDRKPVRAVVVSTQTRTEKSILSAAGRGLVGGLLAGPVGAVIGGATASSFTAGQKVTFAVEYASGRKGTETVEVGSRRFQEIAEVMV